MHMRVTVLSLSVCLLPIYWSFKRLTEWSVHTSWFFAKRWRFSTKGFLRNAFFQVLQFQVSHFDAMRILGCTCGAKYRLLDLAKNSYSMTWIISYYRARSSTWSSSFDLVWLWLAANSFRTLVGTTYMLPFSENLLFIEIKIQNNRNLYFSLFYCPVCF